MPSSKLETFKRMFSLNCRKCLLFVQPARQSALQRREITLYTKNAIGYQRAIRSCVRPSFCHKKKLGSGRRIRRKRTVVFTEIFRMLMAIVTAAGKHVQCSAERRKSLGFESPLCGCQGAFRRRLFCAVYASNLLSHLAGRRARMNSAMQVVKETSSVNNQKRGLYKDFLVCRILPFFL